MIKLNVLHVSQYGNVTTNDCGGAVLSMLAGLSLDEVIEVGLDIGVVMPMSFQEAYKLLRHYAIPFQYKGGLSVLEIKDSIRNGFPVIVLANYGMIPKSERQSSFTGAHWFLAVGFDDDGVFVHDSNWWGDRTDEGAYAYHSNERFARMMAKPGGDDPRWAANPDQGIIIRRPYPVLSETGHDDPDDDAETYPDVDTEQIMHAIALLESSLNAMQTKLDSFISRFALTTQAIVSLLSEMNTSEDD